MSKEATANDNPVILVVDDAPEIIETTVHCLHQDGFRTRIAINGERALALAASTPLPDLILLDVMLPDISGYDVCRRLKADRTTAGIPIIFLTSRTEAGDEQHGFDAGAVDYIAKPISPPVVLRRIHTHLNLKAANDRLRDHNNWLREEVKKRTEEISAIKDVTITAMATLAEVRDEETGNHIHRTQRYVRVLAEHLQRTPRYAQELSDSNIQLIYKSAPLHDIGKIGIPDYILLKSGRLSDEEFEIMKTHTTLGYNALRDAEKMNGAALHFLRYSKEISLYHHEKWDGSGYPCGLSGEDIPLSARLMAVADVYDALISRRVYKPAFPHERAAEIIIQGRGAHFDPEVVDAFIVLQEKFREIAGRFSDIESKN